MKRSVIFIALLLVLATLLLTSCGVCDNYNGEQETQLAEHLYQINEILKAEDFFIAKAQDGKILLYDNEYEVFKEIPFEDYDASKYFISASKDGENIYFTTTPLGVDDEYGILFVNDGSDGFMNGIATIERLSPGNAYRYTAVH